MAKPLTIPGMKNAKKADARNLLAKAHGHEWKVVPTTNLPGHMPKLKVRCACSWKGETDHTNGRDARAEWERHIGFR